MAEPGKEDPHKGRFGIIRRIDDWIFNVEMGILWTFLGVSAVMVFLDVVYRRLAAPDSKVAELAARIFGIESPEAMQTLTTVGPIVTGVIGVCLVYFAFWTAENHASEPGKRSRIKPIIETVVACVGLVVGIAIWLRVAWIKRRFRKSGVVFGAPVDMSREPGQVIDAEYTVVSDTEDHPEK